MTDNGAAGRGFKGGFFGCFGVLAALAVAGLALVMCSAVGAGHDAGEIRSGRAKAGDYLAFCAVGVEKGRGRYFGMAGAEPWIGDDPSVSPGELPTNVGCPAKAAIGRATVRITVRCANALEPSCVEVTGVERPSGEPLAAL